MRWCSDWRRCLSGTKRTNCARAWVHRLTKQVQIQNTNAARAFVGRYGISESDDWIRDVDQVFSKQRLGFRVTCKRSTGYEILGLRTSSRMPLLVFYRALRPSKTYLASHSIVIRSSTRRF